MPRLDATARHPYVPQVQALDGQLQEGATRLPGFDQRDLELGPSDGYRDAWETRTGAGVDGPSVTLPNAERRSRRIEDMSLE